MRYFRSSLSTGGMVLLLSFKSSTIYKTSSNLIPEISVIKKHLNPVSNVSVSFSSSGVYLFFACVRVLINNSSFTCALCYCTPSFCFCSNSLLAFYMLNDGISFSINLNNTSYELKRGQKS